MNADRTFYQSIAGLALATGSLLLVPLVAMQFTGEVVWTPADFVFAGALMFGTGLTYKLVTRKSGVIIYKIAVGLALFAGLFLVWTNLAVGITGSEDNTINFMYFGVVAVGIIIAFFTRFKSRGMAHAMFSMAFAQALVGTIALVGGFYQSPTSSIIEIVGIHGFFIALFVISGLLFRYAKQKQLPENPEDEN